MTFEVRPDFDLTMLPQDVRDAIEAISGQIADAIVRLVIQSMALGIRALGIGRAVEKQQSGLPVPPAPPTMEVR